MKKKTKIALVDVTGGDNDHYKTITVDVAPLTAWKALKHGFASVARIDLERLRAQRKRKGGKK